MFFIFTVGEAGRLTFDASKNGEGGEDYTSIFCSIFGEGCRIFEKISFNLRTPFPKLSLISPHHNVYEKEN